MPFLTFWPSLTSTQGQREERSWSEIFEAFTYPITNATEKNSLPGWSLASFLGDKRAKANVERVFALVLDDDSGRTTLDIQSSLWVGVQGFIFTTWSSTPTAPRHRTILVLSRDVSEDEHTRLQRWARGRCPNIDTKVHDASRLWFVPALRPGGHFETRHLVGAPLDVDAVLAQVPAEKAPERATASSIVNTARLEAARAYLRTERPAIEGEHGGTHTFVVAQKTGLGFNLDEESTFALLWSEWNPRCAPPWDEYGLRRKVREAFAKGYVVAPGSMVGPVVATPGAFEPLALEALLDDVPPPTYHVAALDAAVGRPSSIVGMGYGLKTLAMQAMCVSTIAGTPVWGMFPARQGPCAWLDYEMGQNPMRRRFRRLVAGAGADWANIARGLRLVSLPPLYLNSPGVEDALKRLVEGCSAAFLDSFRRMLPGEDENDSGIARYLDLLLRVSQATDCVFWFIHHATTKTKAIDGQDVRGSGRGSSAIFDGSGSVLSFSGKRNEPVLVQQTRTCEGVTQVGDFRIMAEDVPNGVRIIKAPDPTPEEVVAKAEQDAVREKIRTALGQMGGATSANKVFERVGGKRGAFLDAWREMLSVGSITSDGFHLGRKAYTLVGS